MTRKFDGFGKSGMPFTLAVLAACVVIFVLFWLTSNNSKAVGFFEGFAYSTQDGLSKPWTLLTYGLFNPDPWLLLAVCLLLYYFTGGLEKIWGTNKLALFFLGTVLLTSLLYALVNSLVGEPSRLYSLLIPTTAALVAWAGLYPRTSVMLWGVIPIQSRWMALMGSLLVVFYQGLGKPMYGLTTAIVLAAAYLYSTGFSNLLIWRPKNVTRYMKPGDNRTYDFEKRAREEQEKLRLKELFERSFVDDDDQDKPKR